MESMLDAWSSFNVAMTGAAAGLAGLLIVASSVNIAEIIKSASLTARLAAGIASLVLALVASALALVPGLSAPWYGIVLLLATTCSAGFQIHATRLIFTNRDPDASARLAKSVLGFLPIASYLASALMVLLQQPAGLYLSAVGCVLAIVAGIIVSWVALVEVLR